MHTPLRLLTATLLTAALLGLAAPASAAEPVTAYKGVPTAVQQVTGEPWSAPAFPVDCTVAEGQVSCTPKDPADVTAQQCFASVIVNGTRGVVCTTYAGHVEAIQAAGGTPLLVQYGCSLGDLVCVTFENAGRGMALAATAMMGMVAANTRFDTSTLLWTAAVEEWSFWQWAILTVLFGAMVWAIAAAVVSGDRSELVSAIVRSFIAVVAVPTSLWLTGHVLNAIDDMTWYIINRGGPGSVFQTLQGVMFAGGQANYFFAFLIHFMLMLAMLLLMLVFTFRNIVLAALIAVGPIAWMIFPVRGIGPQWVVRYASSVVVLLLTGPLTIGFVSLITRGLAGVRTIWDPQSWPLLFGLVLVAFAPFAVFGLFSFVGAVAADGIGSRIGATGAHLGSGAARTAMRVPSRIGGTPAGIPAGSTRPGTGGSGPGSRTGSSSRPTGAPSPAGTRATTPQSTSTPTRASSPAPPSSTAQPPVERPRIPGGGESR